MKKFLIIILMLSMALAGCKKAEEEISEPTKDEAVEETEEPVREKTKTALSATLEMSSDWTILDEYSTQITEHSSDDAEDRIMLATSASVDEDGEVCWDDSDEWALAVLTEDGAYNLFLERVQLGDVFFEVSTAYVKGVPKETITVYVFAEAGNKIYNYTYDEAEDVFIGEEVFSTSREADYINKRYSSR